MKCVIKMLDFFEPGMGFAGDYFKLDHFIEEHF